MLQEFVTFSLALAVPPMGWLSSELPGGLIMALAHRNCHKTMLPRPEQDRYGASYSLLAWAPCHAWTDKPLADILLDQGS